MSIGLIINAIPQAFWKDDPAPDVDKVEEHAIEKSSSDKRLARAKTRQRLLHYDIIGDGFWKRRPYLLEE